MNLEENSLAVAASTAADLLGAGQSGVGSHILQDLRALRGGMLHLVAVDAVVVCDLLDEANKQAAIIILGWPSFHTFYLDCIFRAINSNEGRQGRGYGLRQLKEKQIIT